jgi:putative membrane protein
VNFTELRLQYVFAVSNHILKLKIMLYDNYYWGMNFVWWFVWVVILIWIFASPYDIPGQRRRKDTPLDILQKRFAMGQITNTEYQERKKVLEFDLLKMG